MSVRKFRVHQTGVTNSEIRNDPEPRELKGIQPLSKKLTNPSPLNTDRSANRISPLVRRAITPRLPRVGNIISTSRERLLPISKSKPNIRVSARINTPEVSATQANSVTQVRNLIKERYSNRTDLKKVFSQWDLSNSGIVRPEDIYLMASQIGVKTTLDEAQLLVKSFDQSRAGFLQLKDFIRFIHDEVPATFGNKQGAMDIFNLAKVSKADNEQTMITNHMKQHMVELRTKFKGFDYDDTGVISYQNYLFTMRSLNFPKTSVKEKQMHQLYQYMGGDESGINYKTLLTEITKQSDSTENIQNPLVSKFDKSRKSLPPPQVNKSFTLLNMNKVPINIGDKIMSKAEVVRKAIRKKFPDIKRLEKKLVQGAEKISSTELYNMLNDIVGKKVTKQDIEGFVSQFTYNVEDKVATESVTKNIYSEEHVLRDSPQQKLRPIPPQLTKKQLLTRSYDNTSRIKGLLKEIEEKVFLTKSNKSYDVYKSFDHDGDGYISLHDLGKSLAKLDIVHTAEERRGLMNFLDSNANGYVDFKEFSKRIQPDIINKNAKQLNLDTNTTLSSLQPHPNIILDNYKRAKRVTKIHNKLAESFKTSSPPPPATRYGMRPLAKNTFGNIQPSPKSGMYSDEHDRFQQKNRIPLNLGHEDKARKEALTMAKQRIIQTSNQRTEAYKRAMEEKADQFDKGNVVRRAINKDQYLKRIKNYVN